MLDESATSYAGRLSVAKLNIDENTKTPSEYHVRGIPTLMLFKNGQPVATKVGAVSRSQLTAFIEDNPVKPGDSNTRAPCSCPRLGDSCRRKLDKV